MQPVGDARTLDLNMVPCDEHWNKGSQPDHRMHRIHAYPAKFPAFIATKALDLAKEKGVKVRRVADVFCGCGTVAFEARRRHVPFWGCDINPVATMIARVKSHPYQQQRLVQYRDMIEREYHATDVGAAYDAAPERLRYWHCRERYEELCRLRLAIAQLPSAPSMYRAFFDCAFSAILKSSSRWLTKSIKPQVDPVKVTTPVMPAFLDRVGYMMSAAAAAKLDSRTKARIVTKSVLEPTLDAPAVDLIVTSPPYVTSYEYADLHQLSALWLGYADDYRDLRAGSIGSVHGLFDFDTQMDNLNDTGRSVIKQLREHSTGKARAAGRYYVDMQRVAHRTCSMLEPGGMAVFLIADTMYAGTKVENTRHLVESLQRAGFGGVSLSRRRISNKNLTPYRDSKGRFTTDASGRQVYADEFVVVGRKDG